MNEAHRLHRGLDLDLEAGWEEGVEADNQVGVALEQRGHPVDHAGSVDAGRINNYIQFNPNYLQFKPNHLRFHNYLQFQRST